MTEKEIIKGCKKNDAKAFKALYDKYSGLFMAICMRYAKCHADAQDILQDAFIRIFKCMEQYKGDGSFEGWLKRIVVTTAINFYRKKVSTRVVFDEEMVHDTFIDHYPNAIDEMSKEELLKLIQKLPYGYQMVLNLYAIEGYNHKEIAEMLEISEGTSRSQLHKAKKMFAKLLNQNERVSHAK